MTDKQWNLLQNGVEKDNVCHYHDGEKCTAREGALCIALCDTNFYNGECVFFRDKTKMSKKELKEYAKYTIRDKPRKKAKRNG